jgi:hypothetical protein
MTTENEQQWTEQSSIVSILRMGPLFGVIVYVSGLDQLIARMRPSYAEASSRAAINPSRRQFVIPRRS